MANYIKIANNRMVAEGGAAHKAWLADQKKKTVRKPTVKKDSAE